MEDFGPAPTAGLVPVSIKVRPSSGCFHREHSPGAYRIIDDYLSTADFPKTSCQFEEHESGPDILVYLAVTTAGLTFAKSLIDLITAIIKARSEGIKKGDNRSEPLELIIRGFSKEGEFYRETVLRIPPGHDVTQRQIEDALGRRKPELSTPKRKPQKQTRKKK